ncbi:hypothetical protein AB4Y77_00075 [Paenarthrobacter sp. YAF11_1]|uniref:hypothetical protein n=1 Tax=Paenarthrobacter sp. YAF11_1 TaxID=3233074 RepID=UPI003F9E0D7B
MGKQKHDVGWKKRQPREKKTNIPPEVFARKLVVRGLRPASILNKPYKPNHQR